VDDGELDQPEGSLSSRFAAGIDDFDRIITVLCETREPS
jgi:hypothetical protein